LSYSPQIRCCVLAILLSLAGCASSPPGEQQSTKGKTVCDSYIVLHMCVQDYVGDGIVDLIYFSDTNEIFMYKESQKEAVATVMPFHQCAVPMPDSMQKISNRILFRENLSFNDELSIKKDLLFAYLEAKPSIDACNESFEDKSGGQEEPEEPFFIEESEWEEI
jgi:hypothetical protein